MSMSVKQRMALLRRRRNYLERLHDEGRANSYDEAEASALRWALEQLEGLNPT